MSQKKNFLHLREVDTSYPGTKPGSTLSLRDLPKTRPADPPVVDPEEVEFLKTYKPCVKGTIKLRCDTPCEGIPTWTLKNEVSPGLSESRASVFDATLFEVPNDHAAGRAGIDQPIPSPFTPLQPPHDFDFLDGKDMDQPVGTPPFAPQTCRYLDPSEGAGIDQPVRRLLFPSSSQTPQYFDSLHSSPKSIPEELNPFADIFTPKAPKAPAAFKRLHESGPMDPDLARDKFYLETQAFAQSRAALHRELCAARSNLDELCNELILVGGERAMDLREVIEDERDRIDAENDWYWDQATPAEQQPKK